MLCNDCERLERRVAALEAKLDFEAQITVADRLQLALSITRQQAWILAHLFATEPGRPLSRLWVADHVPGRQRRAVSNASLDVQIARLRLAVGQDSISAIYGRGWVLSESGRAVVARALALANSPAA